MSRSYKRTPMVKGGGMGKFAKQKANKRVRRAEIIADGAFYKRVYESWAIYDWKFSALNRARLSRCAYVVKPPDNFEDWDWELKKTYISK